MLLFIIFTKEIVRALWKYRVRHSELPCPCSRNKKWRSRWAWGLLLSPLFRPHPLLSWTRTISNVKITVVVALLREAGNPFLLYFPVWGDQSSGPVGTSHLPPSHQPRRQVGLSHSMILKVYNFGCFENCFLFITSSKNHHFKCTVLWVLKNTCGCITHSQNPEQLHPLPNLSCPW